MKVKISANLKTFLTIKENVKIASKATTTNVVILTISVDNENMTYLL
jgi:hypothetical protein